MKTHVHDTTRNPTLALAVALFLFVSVPFADAQQVPADAGDSSQLPAQQPQPAYTERISVRLVTLPVLARDRRGRPVTDLKPEEIQLVDGGKAYPVAFLSPFFEETEDRKNLPSVRLVTQLPDGAREVAESTVREPRHLLILADLVNDPPQGRKKAVEELEQFLEQELDPSFQVAMMVYDGGLDLALPFTQDRSQVSAALRRAYQENDPGPQISPRLRIEQLLLKLEMCEVDEPDDSFDQDDDQGRLSPFAGVPDLQCLRDSMYEYSGDVVPRATAFLAALEGVIDYAAGLDGHTFVLTIGGNVGLNPSREVGEAMRALYGPMDEISQLEQTLYAEDLVRPHMERLMYSAYENNVSLSFLDRSPMPSDFSVRQRRDLQPGFRPQIVAYQTSQQDLDEVATSTGGAFVASTRLGKGLRESLKMMEGGYYVSFYVNDDETMDASRVQTIRLQSTRSGVNLKHRRAYDGIPREKEAPQRVRGIIQVGFPEPQQFEGKLGHFVPLRLVIDPRDLGYKTEWDEAAAEFTVHLSLRSTKGAMLAETYHVLNHRYPRDLWNSGDVEPPQLHAWADLPDGDYFAEAVVTVPGSGNRGTIRRHIVVRGSDAAAALAESGAEE